ncbi:hypothetical protein COB11_03280 [Candidatus Aerophobetes bacterium]|uniref:Uncharacterized protein n=1 Tax=Aerophobetes bacterium TaxID=2030807 RepID=A0A2A4YJP4_UNCAE|nr:MAG: hypothetical protein COB11_03280 [Candidatus Aerophobetes bacterium]
MSIQYVDESMPFTYFMTHEGSENALLQELDKNHGGASEVQKFMAHDAKKDRQTLLQSIRSVAFFLFNGVLLSIPRVNCCLPVFATLALLEATTNLPLKINNLYQDYKALQMPPTQLTDAARV